MRTRFAMQVDFTDAVSWAAIVAVAVGQFFYLRSPQWRSGQNDATFSIVSSVALVCLSVSNIVRIQFGAPPLVWQGLIVIGAIAAVWGLSHASSLMRLRSVLRARRPAEIRHGEDTADPRGRDR